MLEALLSTLLGERFYPEAIPSDAKLPAGAFTVRDLISYDSHDGPAGAVLAKVLVRIAAENSDDATAMSNDVLQQSQDWAGQTGGGYAVGFADGTRRGAGFDKDLGVFWAEVELELGLMEVTNG